MTNLAGKKLVRPIEGRWLAGVAAGLADYFGLDAGLIRAIFAVLTVLGLLGVVIYLAAWVLVPEEGAEVSIAEKIISKDGT
jgi:phage shock protein C